MRRIGALIGALAFTTTLAGCWEQAGFNAGRTYNNPDEIALTPATIDDAVELWSTDLGDNPAVSLLSANGKVFAADHSEALPTLFGLNAGTGQQLWSHTPEGNPEITVNKSNSVYHDGAVVYGVTFSTRGGVTRLNPDTGAVLGSNSNQGTNLAVANGVVVHGGGGFCCPPLPSSFVAWVNWRCEIRSVGSAGTGPRGGKEYAFVGKNLMWSFGTLARGYRDCNTTTKEWGAPWETDLGGTPVAVAAVGTDRVVYLDDTGTLTLLDAVTGVSLWTAEVGVSEGRPAVAGGTIFLASADNRLVAYSASTGAEIWSAPLGAQGLPPVVASDVVYTAVGSDIVAFDADGCGGPSCPSIASLDTGGPVAEAPIIDDGRLVVGTTDGRVVAFGRPR